MSQKFILLDVGLKKKNEIYSEVSQEVFFQKFPQELL